MASNSSFGRRGSAQGVTRAGVPAGNNAAAPETFLDRLERLPWRIAGLCVIACLAAIYLTQPDPLKEIAKYAVLPVGLAGYVLNTMLAKKATLKRAQDNLRVAARK